jgi:hypothetical protein
MTPEEHTLLRHTLCTLCQLLETESVKWLHNMDSATHTRIVQWQMIMHHLIDFHAERDYKSFMGTFIEYKVSVESLRRCFYGGKRGTPVRKLQAIKAFSDICKLTATWLRATSPQ